MKFVLPPADSILDELGFRKTGPYEWCCEGDLYQYKVTFVDLMPALVIRFKGTKQLSMISFFAEGYDSKDKPVAVEIRRMTQRELEARPDFVL